MYCFFGEAAPTKDPVADFQSVDLHSQLRDFACGLAPGDERRGCLDVVLTGDPQHVRVAYPSSPQAYFDLAWPGCWRVDIFDDQVFRSAVGFTLSRKDDEDDHRHPSDNNTQERLPGV